MIVLLDNYDSFTYNLVQYLSEVDPERRELRVIRNDCATPREIVALRPSHLVISPGPCSPNEAGISCDLIEHMAGRCPILGVCLGHQAIGQVFGGRVLRARKPMHGKTSHIRHADSSLFAGLPQPFVAARYHSLVVEEQSLPATLEPLAWSEDDNELMAIRHRRWSDLIGVQFHPESIATEIGKELLRRFLALPHQTTPRQV